LAISVKNHRFFPASRVFNAPLSGFPLELGNAGGLKKL